ncbi:hypothetical protein ABWH96_02485 [Marivirga tractuosa]|uniref:hypothetical protein n=1 Tax=Marivirga tractuosa TaxID=1006 RepID=UPI0035CFF23D
MPKFTIVFNDNSTKIIEAESKDSLIAEFSLIDATAFQEDVKEIRWDEKNYCCVECISSGKISKTVNTVNKK